MIYLPWHFYRQVHWSQVDMASFTGTWIPAYVPQKSSVIASLLVFCSIITSTTFGYGISLKHQAPSLMLRHVLTVLSFI